MQEFFRLFIDVRSLEQQQLLFHEQWASHRSVQAHLDAFLRQGAEEDKLQKDNRVVKKTPSLTEGRQSNEEQEEEDGEVGHHDTIGHEEDGEEEKAISLPADENAVPPPNQSRVDRNRKPPHSSSSSSSSLSSVSMAVAKREEGGKNDPLEKRKKDTEERTTMMRKATTPRPLADPLFLLLLHTEVNSGVNGAYRFGVGRLLELVADGDMTVLACIEKVFFLSLSANSSTSSSAATSSSSSSSSGTGGTGGGHGGVTGIGAHQSELKKAADSFFSLAMQPSKSSSSFLKELTFLRRRNSPV